MRTMRSTAVRLGVVLVAGLVWPASSSGGDQAGAGTPARRDAILAAGRDIMQAARFCAVITVDQAGRAQARTVDALPPDGRMVVWFATNPKTRKVGEIEKDARVTLYYFDPASMSYATLLGHARLVHDPAEKQKHWKKDWDAFWPDRGPAALLVEVTPDRLEVVSEQKGIKSDPVTWAPAAVDFAGK